MLSGSTMRRSNISVGMAIAIVIVLVLVLIFYLILGGSFGSLMGTSNCENSGGTCISGECHGSISGFTCPKDRICCIDIG